MRKKNLGDPSKAVGYLRVSTEDQNLGPEAQLAAMRRWCETHEIDLVAVHADHGVSGGAPLDKRAGLLAAVDDLQARGAGVLLVAKRDRLARDTMLAAMAERLVERNGARIQSADNAGNGTGPEAQLFRTLVDAFAQYERALIRARTKAALAVKAAKGQRVGQIAFGYQLNPDGVTLDPDPAEQEVLAYIRDLRESGLSLRAIVARLNDEGIAARGARWHLTSVYRLLQRDPIEAAETAA